jgi:hypothetical protein
MAIYNGYVGAKTCTQGPTTGARGAMSWFLAKYADDGGLNAGIYNCRPIRGSTRTTSLHGEGRAVDLAIRPYSAKYGSELADLIRRHSAELGIQCVIWNRRIWSGYYDEFRPYTGKNPHVDHLHVELSWTAANGSTAATVALWEKVLGHLVDDEGDVKPVASKPSTPAAKPSTGGGSVVDWLAAKGRDSSYAARARLAAQYGIGGYSGTAAQNTALLAKLKGGAPASKPKPAGKSVAKMADEVIAGNHGTGHDARCKSLGISATEYAKVRAEVNRRAGIKTPAKPKGKSVSQMATEVIQGKHGNGHPNRQKSLGVNNATYAKVRAEVNRRA